MAAAEATVAELSSLGAIRAVRCDATDRAEVDRLFDDIWASEGPVDVAFSNVGAGGMAKIIDTPIDEVHAQFATNFADCERVGDAIRANGVQAMVCFECRFSAHFRMIRSILDEGLIGDVHYAERFDSNSKIEARPTVADDKIYAINHKGEAFVFATGPEFKLLHKTDMGEGRDGQIRSTIAISGGNLFIRTDNKLYCIGG